MVKAKKSERKEKGKKDKNKTTLIITEKPQAAQKIANALSDGKDEKISRKNKVSYYEFSKDGRRVVVGCAVGHLFGLKQKGKGSEVPRFDIEWQPNFKDKKATYTKKYYDVLKKLIKNSDEFVVATDYDVEGEVIGWNVVRFLKKDAEAKTKRMKFSSLTKDELKNAWENLHDNLNWGQAIAGETRHYLDWFYGINLSRSLMKAMSKTGKFRILSIGRVQGPALEIVANREKEIQNFKPIPFWEIFLQVKDIDNKKVEVKFPENIWKESDLLKFKHLRGKKGQAETTKKQREILPPVPFDLTTLQTEAYKFFKFSPQKTLQVAQNLYLSGLISYPRTSSQKYAKMNFDKILKSLKKYTELTRHVVNKKPVEGRKTDPAHPAISPTGNFAKISGDGKKIYDLIVRRFIAGFCDNAIVEDKKLKVEVGGLKFYAKGLKIKSRGWMNVYKRKLKEQGLDEFNGEVDVNEIRIEEKQTEPPKRWTAASLVRELEKRELGTKATRGGIVQTLYDRGYIKARAIEVTPLGMKLSETLEKYSPIILDEELTRKIEKQTEGILEQGFKNTEKKKLEKEKQKIIDNAKDVIKKIAGDMVKHEDKIGKELAEGHVGQIKEEVKENQLMLCPVCKKGNLQICYGKKFKRYFVGCSNYPKCRNTYSLPPYGLMKPARDKDEKEFCQECGFTIAVALRKGRRPWKFCFNPACPTNAEWVKKKEEFKKKMQNQNKEPAQKYKKSDNKK